MVPAPLSIAVTVPCPLARIGVAAAGAIAILSVLPVISEESGVSAFWPQAAVRPARPKTRLNRNMYIVFSFMQRDWLSDGTQTNKLLTTEERLGGKEFIRTSKSWWAPYI